MYHGTSSIFLKKILKVGLLASPPTRIYDDGDLKTIGGTYITRNVETAIDYGQEATEKHGGQVILVTVQYVQDSGYVDEDYIMQQISTALSVSQKFNERELTRAQRIYKNITNPKLFKISDGNKPLIKEYSNMIAETGKVNVYTIHRDENIANMRQKVLRLIKPQDIEKISELFIDRDITFKGKTRIVEIANIDTNEIIYPKKDKKKRFIIAYDFDNEMTYSLEIDDHVDSENFVKAFERATKIKIDDYRTVVPYDENTKKELQKDTDIDTDDFEIIGDRIKLK
jgi:hypothetical protein